MDTDIVYDMPCEFEKFETIQGLVHETEVLKLLHRCAYIVGPLMRRHGWTAIYLTEVTIDAPIYGQSLWITKGIDGRMVRKSIDISLRTRYLDDHTKILPFHFIMQSLLHELTHIEYSEHSLGFYRLSARLLMELQEDVKEGRVMDVLPDEIPTGIAGFREMCRGVTKMALRLCLRWK